MLHNFDNINQKVMASSSFLLMTTDSSNQFVARQMHALWRNKPLIRKSLSDPGTELILSTEKRQKQIKKFRKNLKQFVFKKMTSVEKIHS